MPGLVQTWRDRLKPASFRGVSFGVLDHAYSGGHKWARHEYVNEDLPWHESLRDKTKVFTITGFVLGKNYDRDRDKLIEACEKDTAGILVHPYLGEKRVICQAPIEVRETHKEGGYAAFTMTFEETSVEVSIVPSPTPDFLSQLESAAQELTSTAATAFESRFNPLGPNFIVTEFLNDVANYSNSVAGMIRSIPEAIGETGVGQLVNTIHNLDASMADIVYSGASVASAIQGTIEGIADLPSFSRSFAAWNALKEICKWGRDDKESGYIPSDLSHIPLTTDSREQQQENRDALTSLIHTTALAEASLVALDLEYSGQGEATYIRETMADYLDHELLRAGDNEADEEYYAIRDLKTKMSLALQVIKNSLPEIVTYVVPPATIPAIVLAYDRYEDLSREDDIVDNNMIIQHPGFLPEGHELELLSA